MQPPRPRGSSAAGYSQGLVAVTQLTGLMDAWPGGRRVGGCAWVGGREQGGRWCRHGAVGSGRLGDRGRARAGAAATSRREPRREPRAGPPALRARAVHRGTPGSYLSSVRAPVRMQTPSRARSRSPVDLPLGTAARNIPWVVNRSTSTVGLPLESKIWRALRSLMVAWGPVGEVRVRAALKRRISSSGGQQAAPPASGQRGGGARGAGVTGRGRAPRWAWGMRSVRA